MIFNSYVNVYQRVGELDHPKVSFPLEMVFPHHLRIAAETRRSFGGWVVWCGWNFSYHSCLSTKNGKLDSNFCLNPLDILFLLLGWLLCWITPDYSHFFSMWLLPHRRVFCKKSIHGAMEKDQPHYIIFIYTVYIYISCFIISHDMSMIFPWYSDDFFMIFSWYSDDMSMIFPYIYPVYPKTSTRVLLEPTAVAPSDLRKRTLDLRRRLAPANAANAATLPVEPLPEHWRFERKHRQMGLVAWMDWTMIYPLVNKHRPWQSPFFNGN